MTIGIVADQAHEQRVEILEAALPEIRELLVAGATSVVASSDGKTVTITSDKLDAPKVVVIGGE